MLIISQQGGTWTRALNPTPGFLKAIDVCVNAKDVLTVCEPYNVKLVLQGHQHIYERIRHHGIDFITGGAVCGAWWSGPYQGDEEGFLHFVVAGDDYKCRWIDYGWEV